VGQGPYKNWVDLSGCGQGWVSCYEHWHEHLGSVQSSNIAYELLAYRQGLCLMEFVNDQGNGYAWPDFL